MIRLCLLIMLSAYLVGKANAHDLAKCEASGMSRSTCLATLNP